MKQTLNAWAIENNSMPARGNFLNKKHPSLLFLALTSLLMLFANLSNAQNCTTCALGYPDNSNLPKSAVVFNENEILRAMDPSASSCGYAGGYIKLWYNDEHAMTLGVRQVNVKTAAGTTTTNYPITAYGGTPTCFTNPLFGATAASGDQSGNDVADGGGRPLRPILYITDLTVNGPSSRIGDWQQGGVGYNPSIICGSWKSAVRLVDYTVNPVKVTVTPDANPAKNDWNLAGGEAPPTGTTNEGYGTLVKWDVTTLGLQAGHIYRIQIMVHDGDQNKTGGDVGSMCTTIAMPPDCSCVTSTSNLLINPSFENGATGWSTSGGTLTTGTGFVVCGAANGFLNWSTGTAKVWQDVVVAEGSVVTFNAYSGTHTPGISCSPRISLIYLNSAGGVISQSDAIVTKDVDVTGSALELYTLSGTAPAGTVKVRVQGSITCNTLKLDAFCLTVIPPPVTIYPDFNVTYVNVPVPGDVSTNDKVPTGTLYGTTPTLISSPAGSSPSITMNTNGTYSFVSNLVGIYVYKVPVCAPGAATPCPTSLLTITVLCATCNNNPPVANTDIATTKLNTAVILRTLANDRAGNPGGALVPSTVVVTVAALHGTSSINAATGDNTYTPATGYVGMDTLTYKVFDNSSPALFATALQIINIKTTTATNTTLAADDYAYTPVNTAVSGNAKTNDTDPEGNTQTITAQTTTVAGKGTLVLAVDGSFTFTPVAGFTGPVSFPYTTTDNGSPVATAKATIYILVSPVMPDMYPDFNVTYVNVHVPGNVNTNDKVPAGTTYGTTPTLTSSPAGSTAVIVMNSNGTYDFVADKVGVYVYKVPVCVPGQVAPCPTTLLTITVLSSGIDNNPPVANTDIATTRMNQPVVLKTLINDRAGNPGGALVPSTVVVTVAALHGTSSINPATGDNTYTPAAGYVGMDTLTYRVCDNSTPSLCATALQIINVKSTTSPNTTLAADDYAFTPINTNVSGNVKTNDTDPEGNNQTVIPQITTTIPGKGELVLAGDGSYTFFPVTGFTGPVNFPYTTCDNGTPQACASATLYILVSPEPPAMYPDFNATYVNIHVPGNVNTNDKVPVGTTYGTSPSLISSPAASTPVIVMNSNGTYDFVSDKVGVYVYKVPVCVPGATSPCPATLLTITVLGPTINTNPPVANTDIATTKVNTPVVLRSLDNDRAGNPGGALVPSTVVVTIAPLHGTTSINPATGENTYTPAPGYVGNDTLTYRVFDNNAPTALSATAIQIISIKTTVALNSTLAADDYAFTPINTAVSGNLKTNDSDPEGNAQTITPQTTTVAGKGTLVLAADGSYTFTPVAGYTGPVNFPYTTTDNGVPVATAMATLYIVVSPIVIAYPDLSPAVFQDGTTLFVSADPTLGARDNVIRIFNLFRTDLPNQQGPTTAPIIFTLAKMDPAYQITIDPNATSSNVFGGTPVANADWTIVDTGIFFVFTSKPGVVIPLGGFKDIGINLKALRPNSSGNIVVNIVFGTGGGETPTNNNVRSILFNTN